MHRLSTLIRALYKTAIGNQKDEVNFWVLMGFIFTFSMSRLFVYIFPDFYVQVKNTHIHHFAYGILILAVVGLAALNDWHHRKRRVFGAIYGIGLGLAMDEFGMWIRLDDDYWLRHSYDAITITASILVLSVYFEDFWKRLIKLVVKEEVKEGKKLIEKIKNPPKTNG